MKTYFALLAWIFIAASCSATTTISFVGSVEGTEVTDWRTVSTLKTLDGDSDNFYGTYAAYTWSNALASNNTPVGSSLPGVAFVTDNDRQLFNGDYTSIDHVNDYPADQVPGIIIPDTPDPNGSFTFEMTGTVSTYENKIVRVGIMADILRPNEWAADQYKGYQIIGMNTTGDSGVAVLRDDGFGVGQSGDGVPEMYFFDITDVSPGDRFQMIADNDNGGSTNQVGYLAPISFDLIDIAQQADFGDFNGDGSVNLADYTVWRNNLGATEDGMILGGNGNGDNVVDELDYNLWKQYFGNSSNTPGINSQTAAIPEPSSIILLSSLLLSVACYRKRL